MFADIHSGRAVGLSQEDPGKKGEEGLRVCLEFQQECKDRARHILDKRKNIDEGER